MEKDKPFLEVPKQFSHSLAIWAIYAYVHIAHLLWRNLFLL